MEMTILAKLELGNWQQLFAERIYERGLEYYEGGAVHDIKRTGNKITASVEGSDTYRVMLYIKEEAVYRMTCTCPYAAKGENCKHMAATLLALADNPLSQAESETNDKERTWKEILQSMSEREVRSFLFRLLEDAPEQQQALVLTYSPGILSKKEMQKLLYQAKRLCRPYQRDGFVEYKQESELYNEVGSYLDRVILPLVKRNCGRDAFTLVNQVVTDLMELDFEESGESLLELCQESWENIIRSASADEQQEWYSWFEKQLQLCRRKMKYDLDCGYRYGPFMRFYESLLLEAFPPIRSFQLRNLVWVDEILEQYGQDEEEIHSRFENSVYGAYLVKRIQLMRALSYPTEEIEKYIAGHYNNRVVRDMLIREFFEKGEYEKAIPVLRDSMDQPFGWGYEDKLLTAYEAIGDTENYKQELWILINKSYQYNLDTILKFKKYCSDEEWKKRIREILRLKTCASIRPAIFAEEKMVDKLWDDIRQMNDMAALARYENVLRPHYEKEILDMYVQYVRILIPDSRHRNQYRNCIQYLKKICQFSGGEKIAQNLAREWKHTYTTRKAMKEELKLAGF